jgi:hypothetical protein
MITTGPVVTAEVAGPGSSGGGINANNKVILSAAARSVYPAAELQWEWSVESGKKEASHFLPHTFHAVMSG